MHAHYVIVGAGSAGCAMAYRLAEAGRVLHDEVVDVHVDGVDLGEMVR